MKTLPGPTAQPASESDPLLMLPTNDPRRGAIERVLASPGFQRSPRSTELLLYLCRQALLKPSEGISEQDIAVDVYGRTPGYNSSEDAIARVQVSQLRKRLHLYSVDQGAGDPVIIEIRAGSYTPVFRDRQAPAPDDSTAIAPTAARPTPIWSVVNWVTIVILGIFSVWFLYQNVSLKRAIQAKFPAAPDLDRLWTSIFRQDRPLQIVLSDSTLMQLSDLTGKRVTLRDYRESLFPSSFLSRNVPDRATLDTALQLVAHVYTTTQDADAAWRISRITLRYGVPTSLVSARDLRLEPLTSGDLVLLGHPYSDPWIELFEDRMNFRFEIGPNWKRSIINIKPQRGEQAAYSVDLIGQRTGYCVIAFQPKPIGTGNALLILGTDMTSTEAGLQMISDNASASELLKRIGVKSSGPLPYFEVLVKVKLLGSVVPGFEFVAQRTSPR